VDEIAGRTPEGWPGWPEGKKFAFVLTHDVESPEGVANSQALADLETSHGFRSSFNFIPEGTYSVDPALRTSLRAQGFEIGIHDLHHDGKLYRSRDQFRQNATRINSYLKDWDATGFRSGFMLHELNWLHDLDIKYDASTFDTDPFEPQPVGAGTIFPFWVQPPPDHPYSRGYVELPYTLPQDSTLFLIFREPTPEIWLKKLDWVAEHGGMALVNVHPDYLCFEGTPRSSGTFPVEHYSALLDHVRQRYPNAYWHPLPRDLATWYENLAKPRSSAVPEPVNGRTTSVPNSGAGIHSTPVSLRGKRAAVLVYGYYPADSRVRRAAEAMIKAGMATDVFCLSENPAELPQESVDGVNVFRLPLTHTRGGKSSYISKYLKYFFKAFLWLSKQRSRQRYDVVHVHNMPDFLIFAALVDKLRGATLILDLHDPMPELMMSIYGLKTADWQVRVLRALERSSIRFANVVLTPNIAFRDLFNSRGCPPGKMKIIMNSPEAIFNPERYPGGRKDNRTERTFRIMHHGSIVHRHGLDLMIEAAAKVRSRIPGLQVDIYGPQEPYLDTVLEQARALGISDIVHYHGNKNANEIAQAILETDLGVIPNRRSTFTEINFPTRIFEYLVMGRLVVAPATRGITDYFGPDDLLMYEQNNVDQLAERILWVREHPEAANDILERARRVYQKHRWTDEENRFLDLVESAVTSG
jgi:glycosyltransferase involved in cell wall biosynthesis